MSTASRFQPLSVEDYLDGEFHAQQKHEFVGGSVFAKGGGSVQHNQVASNATGILYGRLCGKPCRNFNSDREGSYPVEQWASFLTTPTLREVFENIALERVEMHEN